MVEVKKNSSFYALKPLIIVVLVLGGILIPLFSFTFTTNWEEDFEGYAVGPLSNNPKWSEQASTYFTATDESAYIFTGSRGGKADSVGTTTREIYYNPSDAVSTGTKGFSWLQKPTYWTSSYFGNLYFYFKPTAGTEIGVGLMNERFEGANIFSINFSANVVDCDTGEHLGYSGGADWDPNTRIDKDTWVYFEVEAFFDDKIFKIKPDVEGLDPAEKCFWFNSTGASAELLKLRFSLFYNRSAFDDFQKFDICAIGTCSACQIYNTCVETGCQWYYSEQMYLLFGQGGYCVEPTGPIEEECGAFYKCQFCTEEQCGVGGLEGFCEWVDKGAGLGCYMTEPEIPPEQVEWELPELENCDELAGVEKWLCIIKNFIAGIFSPSEAKINALWSTLRNFQQKFPFNYIMALDRFFKDVASDTEEKGIPLDLFGNEANISFSFWSRTGEVGGVVESFSSVVKDFSTLFLIIGFGAWLLMLIRRFWS